MTGTPKTKDDLLKNLQGLSNVLERVDALRSDFKYTLIDSAPDQKPRRSPVINEHKYLLLLVVACVPLAFWNMLNILLLVHAFAFACYGLYVLISSPTSKIKGLLTVLCGVAVALVALVIEPEGATQYILTIALLLAGMVAGVYLSVSAHNDSISLNNRLAESKHQKDLEESKQAVSGKLNRIEADLSDVQKEFQQGEYNTWFPRAYLASFVVTELINLIDIGLADTLKQAIEKYLKDERAKNYRALGDRHYANLATADDEQWRTEEALDNYAALIEGIAVFQREHPTYQW